jgi:hypothetical protein
MSEYVCALSGVEADEDDLVESTDDDLSDLPVGWTKITVQRRLISPRWLEVQDAKKRWAAEMTQRGFKDPKLLEDMKVRPLSQLLKSPREQAKREKPWQSVEAR